MDKTLETVMDFLQMAATTEEAKRLGREANGERMRDMLLMHAGRMRRDTGLTAFGVPGESSDFDPQFHTSSEPIRAGQAVTVISAGFRLGNTVARKAVVSVARKPF